ncbi:MMPL family transporter [Tessaracoccus rhinocerotis]|uniref:MMPL family transporter n=1 Tax=Tessaracoccus rhinocerotis TaxID=1689449 RepID=A0A553K039_9ACTN|nr:MMPL family transporter [Tessaracoccus rhinocerotis]TRY18071.1 MMPL family transporter [Tessaracoccus rhinocerotis]
MSAQLYALGRWCFRNRLKVIGVWIALLVVLGGTAVALGPKFSSTFEIPGSSSQEALEKLSMTFPQGAAMTATAIVVAPEGTDIADLRTEIEQGVSDLAGLEVVDNATSPWDEFVSGQVSEDGTAAIIQLQLNVTETPTDAELASITDAGEKLQSQMPAGTEVAMGGEAFNIDVPALSIIEAIGLVVAFIVLFVLLGSLVAAGLPLITAVVGVGVAMGIMLIFSQVADLNSVTPLLAVMLGLAVGIDYALFILSRHRDQLRDGMEVEESAARAVGTAGSAVVFAGVTVFIALLGLGVAGIPFLTVMGVFAALTIVFAVLIALTMLPAFIGLVGERMRPKPRRSTKSQEEPEAPGKRGGLFAWWVGVTTKHPVVTIVAVVLSLGALTIPAAGMQLSLPNAGQNEPGTPSRVAYDLIAEHFGPGYNGPLVVTADIIASEDPLGLVEELKADILALDGVAGVPLATPNPNVDTALIQVIPTTASDDAATALVVEDLKRLGEQWEDELGVSTAVTGYTAVQLDVTAKLSAALVPFAILVVGLSMVLLAAVFRSVWVPVKATVGYILSVGAAFGASTLVFNEGWLKELVNLERGMPLISFLPILVMGILFGLAMDYEVFLVSRMREEYVHGKSAIESIRAGFVASGPVVMAAALIMFGVFAFFVPEGMGPIKQIAFALAVGVMADAFLVRMTLVPAVLALLGDRAWWLPKWLDKLLPSFDVEGEVLTKKLELANWPGDGSLLHADQISVEGVVDPISLKAVPGNVIGIAGPLGARTGLALALSGRLAVTSGRARVVGELVPESASLVRRRTTYVDLAVVPSPVAALEGIEPRAGTVVFVDSVDVVASEAEKQALGRLVEAARGGEFALVVCAGNAAHLEETRPDGIVTVTEAAPVGSNA